jgi:hypothetical protein
MEPEAPNFEPLRAFLLNELAPDPVELDEDETITEALVIYRISSLDEDGINERYEYSVTRGVNLAMAFGMLELSTATIMDYYQSLLDRGREEDEE